MIASPRIATLALSLLAAPGLSSPVPGQEVLRKPPRAKDRWIDDWEAARSLAAKEGKPVFVVFR